MKENLGWKTTRTKEMKENLGWKIYNKEFSKNKSKFNDPLRMLYSDEGFAFEKEWECLPLLAKDIEEGDFIIMNNNKLFQVDIVEPEFASDEIAEKYSDDDEEVEDGDTIYSFIDEDNGGSNGVSLNNISFDEKFMVIRIKKGTY
jgi:hypothetical protein